VAGGHPAQAQADDYPSRNITFLCPFPGRRRHRHPDASLGAGASGQARQNPSSSIIAWGRAPRSQPTPTAKSAPDGYTIFIAPVTTLAIGPSVFKSLPYDTVKDFAPIGLVGSAQFALVANPDLNAPTLPDLIKLIKSKNGQMSYATSGASTPHHLFMEMFLKAIDAKAQHIPYRGSAPAMMDIISGQVPFMMIDLAVAMGAIKEGKLKVYGVTSATRIKAMPDVPTLAEAGLPGFRRDRLVLGGGACRHAAPDHRQAQRRADALHQPPGDFGPAQHARHHAAHQHAG
jgi:hypothetical protein